jgi:thymidylate synthase ThyX
MPSEMGLPKDHQNQGTELERLAEIAGRICYDSMGRGRSSAEWHKHILEVDHLSVYEHGQITIGLDMKQFEGEHESDASLEALGIVSRLMGRPGITARFHQRRKSLHELRISFNPRCVLDWDKLPFGYADVIERQILSTMARAVQDIAPQMMQNFSYPGQFYEYEHVDPHFETEKWVSFWLKSSRGWSHEQVRHGDFTGISQRSTRYVDESESDWHWHPLLAAYLKENTDDLTIDSFLKPLDSAMMNSKDMYKVIVTYLEPWLAGRGVDKATARKQARGAARGFLGNALSTQMIFSASVWEWKCILKQRMSPHADAEIRLVVNEVFDQLLDCNWGMDFADYDVEDSPDGIGMVLV